MTCIVEYNSDRHTERELTPELINALNEQAEAMSGEWENYVLCMYVGKDNKIHLYFDGPWEC